MSICQNIVDRLTKSKAPGMTAEAAAAAVGITTTAFMNHIKHIRRRMVVVATADEKDARVKHYRIPRSNVTAAPEKTSAPGQRSAEKATLSATELEIAICKVLRSHASAKQPMSMDDLVAHTGQPRAMVRPAIIALVQRETVIRVAGGYHLPPLAKPVGAVAGPRVVEVMHGHYNGAELRPYNGRPGGMDAYKLPSRGMRA